MIKFDKNEFLKPQIYSTLDEYETRCNVTKEIIKEIEQLQQQCRKQKEVIIRAIEYINHFSKESEVKIYGLPKCKVFIGDIEQLLDILKEVE